MKEIRRAIRRDRDLRGMVVKSGAKDAILPVSYTHLVFPIFLGHDPPPLVYFFTVKYWTNESIAYSAFDFKSDFPFRNML